MSITSDLHSGCSNDHRSLRDGEPSVGQEQFTVLMAFTPARGDHSPQGGRAARGLDQFPVRSIAAQVILLALLAMLLPLERIG